MTMLFKCGWVRKTRSRRRPKRLKLWWWLIIQSFFRMVFDSRLKIWIRGRILVKWERIVTTRFSLPDLVFFLSLINWTKLNLFPFGLVKSWLYIYKTCYLLLDSNLAAYLHASWFLISFPSLSPSTCVTSSPCVRKSIREPDTSRSNHPTSSVVHMSKDEKERRRTNRSHHLIITNHHWVVPLWT